MNAAIGSTPGCPANDSVMLDKSVLDKETAGRTSKVLLFIHEARDRINDGFYSWGNNWDIPGDTHNSGTTVAYADGHCKWGSRKSLLKEMDSYQWLSNTKLQLRTHP